jgi:S1-C subfamily serine protease
MRNLTAALLFVFAALWALVAPDAIAWHERHVADYAQNSIMRLTIHLEDGREGTCSGFVIQPGIVMTAKHCTEDGPVTADDKPTTLIARDDLYDLALLATDTGNRPALQLRSSGLLRGEHVTAIGYAGGQGFLAQMPGSVMLLRARVEADIAPCVIMSYIGIPGMSGGPIIDSRGLVVSVVSRGITGIACGMSPELLHAFLYGAP